MRLRLRLQLWMRMLMWVLLLSEACVCHFFGLVFCSFSAELQQLPAVEGCFEAPQQAIALFGLAYQTFRKQYFQCSTCLAEVSTLQFQKSCSILPGIPADASSDLECCSGPSSAKEVSTARGFATCSDIRVLKHCLVVHLPSCDLLILDRLVVCSCM